MRAGVQLQLDAPLRAARTLRQLGLQAAVQQRAAAAPGQRDRQRQVTHLRLQLRLPALTVSGVKAAAGLQTRRTALEPGLEALQGATEHFGLRAQSPVGTAQRQGQRERLLRRTPLRLTEAQAPAEHLRRPGGVQALAAQAAQVQLGPPGLAGLGQAALRLQGQATGRLPGAAQFQLEPLQVELLPLRGPQRQLQLQRAQRPSVLVEAQRQRVLGAQFDAQQAVVECVDLQPTAPGAAWRLGGPGARVQALEAGTGRAQRLGRQRCQAQLGARLRPTLQAQAQRQLAQAAAAFGLQVFDRAFDRAFNTALAAALAGPLALRLHRCLRLQLQLQRSVVGQAGTRLQPQPVALQAQAVEQHGLRRLGQTERIDLHGAQPLAVPLQPLNAQRRQPQAERPLQQAQQLGLGGRRPARRAVQHQAPHLQRAHHAALTQTLPLPTQAFDAPGGRCCRGVAARFGAGLQAGRAQLGQQMALQVLGGQQLAQQPGRSGQPQGGGQHQQQAGRQQPAKRRTPHSARPTETWTRQPPP